VSLESCEPTGGRRTPGQAARHSVAVVASMPDRRRR
jgi:hypothetical protein